jgi:hypothetical protein
MSLSDTVLREALHESEYAKLKAINAELLDVLKVCRDTLRKRGMPTQPEMLEAADKARAAIAKAEGK